MYYTQRPWKWLKSSNEPRKIKAVYRTIWTARAMAAAIKESSDCWAAHEATVKLCNAFRDVCNRRAAHEVICVDAKKAPHRTFEIKRKATEIQEGVATLRERTSRITNEHAREEGHVNDGIGYLVRALQAAAKATHSLTCGVPDRESNEIEGGNGAH